MRNAWKGIPLMNNESALLVEEYFSRKNLCEIGYRFTTNSLHDFKVESFGIITSELNKIEKEETKKAQARRK